tara:strand:+ start:3617 stop:4141 length:525 start_codon:yes stop_codon:yes gene_type:complete
MNKFNIHDWRNSQIKKQLKEQNTTAGDFEVNVPVQNEMEKVKIKYGHATGPLDDVTISWEQESGDKVTSHSYTLDFQFDETVDKALAYDEFDIDLYVAKSKDDKYTFEVEVEVTPREFSGDGGIINNDESAVRWDTLEITLNDDESDEEGKPFGFDDIPDDLREHFKKLAGIIK